MTIMRAKMQVVGVAAFNDTNGQIMQENLTLYPVAKSGAYPSDGSDEDNSYARWTPSGELKLTIQNPALFGKLPVGSRFYVDFTPAE